MTRAEILEAARVCVCGDREQDYFVHKVYAPELFSFK